MSKGGMQSSACHSTYCKFCNEIAIDGIELSLFKDNKFLGLKYIFKHLLKKSGNAVFCDENNIRKAKLYDENWKLIK